MPTRAADEQARGIMLLWSVAAVLAALVLAGCGGGEQTSSHSGTTPKLELGRLTPAASSMRRVVPVPGRPVPTSVLPTLRAIASRVAKGNGDRAPAWVSVVVTTHEKALTSATPGDTEPFGQETIVYLVTMKGHFVDKEASTPPGAHAPTGTYLSIVIDAKTFESLDFGLSPKPPPVAPGTFGPVIYLKAVA